MPDIPSHEIIIIIIIIISSIIIITVNSRLVGTPIAWRNVQLVLEYIHFLMISE